MSRPSLPAALRLARPAETWFKPALSVLAAGAVPDFVLLGLGRLDLLLFTMAGSLCALYGHQLPYAARARAVALVALGMTAGLGLALLAGAATDSVPLLVLVGAALAAAQKALADATRIGPPGHVIFVFVSSGALFVHQPMRLIPGHLALTLAAGALAWLITVSPVLLRPHGPERRATGRALAATAAFAAAPQPGSRAAATGAVHAAWQTLAAAGRQDGTRRALAGLLAGAERSLAVTAPDADAADRLRSWERSVRRRDPLPAPARPVPLAAVRPEPWWRQLPAFGPLAARTFLGCLLAGLAAHALGVGRPAWALVTAASLYQANLTLTWSRALQRTLGNLLGVLAFAALAPFLLHTPLLLVAALLACGFGAEALITRNYWLGTVCVTPMALLLTEFGPAPTTSALVADRTLDTLVGAVVGMAAALVVANRRAVHRIGRAVSAVHQARARTEAALADGGTAPAHRHLAAALVELRTAADTAAGEWRAGTLPEQQVRQAEAAGHHTLAEAVRSQGVRLPEPVRVQVQEAQAA